MRRERSPDLDCLPLSASLHTLCEPLTAFDAKAQAWEHYTNTPLGRLRQELTLRHLLQHLVALPTGLSILDAGGGTGSYALPLARLGHRVCLLDFSAQMLDTARAKIEQLAPSLMERIDPCHASIEEIPDLFPPDHFDVIMCHTLLEYVSEPCEILRALTAVLRPGGLLSCLFANPCADPLCWALAKGDLEKARLALCEHVSSADLFGLPRRTFTAKVMGETMIRVGLELMAEYGVRIFADYVPAEKLADAQFFDRLLELELAAGTLSPYKLIARYIQLLGRKPEAS